MWIFNLPCCIFPCCVRVQSDTRAGRRQLCCIFPHCVRVHKKYIIHLAVSNARRIMYFYKICHPAYSVIDSVTVSFSRFHGLVVLISRYQPSKE